MATRKKQKTDETVTDENSQQVVGVVKTTVDIRSKVQHSQYLAWALSQLPDIYSPAVKITPTGYQVIVSFKNSSEGSQYFVARYLAHLVGEIRTLDESNLKYDLVLENQLASKSELVG